MLNPVYIEKVDIIPSKDYIVVPPSHKYLLHFIFRTSSIFENSQTMDMKDKRFYTQLLRRQREQTGDDLRQAHKLGTITLGHLQVDWVNSFGESIVTASRLISVRYGVAAEKVLVALIDPPALLYLEEPQSLSLKVTNVSGTSLNIKLFIKPEEAKAIAISSLSKKVCLTLTVGPGRTPSLQQRHSQSPRVPQSHRPSAAYRTSCTGYKHKGIH